MRTVRKVNYSLSSVLRIRELRSSLASQQYGYRVMRLVVLEIGYIEVVFGHNPFLQMNGIPSFGQLLMQQSIEERT
jgi:hypothetical protein